MTPLVQLTRVLAVALAIGCGFAQAAEPVLVIHGGAGAMPRSEMSADKEKGYRAGLGTALDAGFSILQKGGSSLDAVVEVVRVLEDDPQFNAGKGAVLNHDGQAELDASLMDGRDLRAGSVAGVMRVKNPILLARLVMDKSVHVMLVGAGAEEFALENGVTLVPNTYFHTEHRLRQLEAVKAKAKARPTGTVGAVALDANGNLAAATSTGGMEDKRFGRVGDSPIIGAGTYADNSSCAVSGTGWGEAFMRVAAAHEVSARMLYLKESVSEAARAALRKLARIGGDGGLIALDRRGNIAMPFNSEGMLRACIHADGRREFGIYRRVVSNGLRV
jgi:L-asparaginase / beta-aspartyl-peptidase